MAYGEGRVFLRNRLYSIAYFLRGEEIREPAHTYDEKQARKFLKARMKEVGADQIGAKPFITPKASRIKISELRAALQADYELRHIASPQNLCHLRRVEKDFGQARAMHLTSEQIDIYVKQRIDAGDRPATVNRTTEMLAQCYRYAIERGHLNRMPKIRKQSEAGNVRKGFIRPGDFAKLLPHLPDDGLRDFCEWAYVTGQRKGEASQLAWDMVSDNELLIPGDITKPREARTIPLVGKLAEIIERRRAARAYPSNGATALCEYIFHRFGKRIRHFDDAWKSACKAAEIGPRLFHNLRRSAVKNLTAAGIPQVVAMKVSGHLTTSVFKRYNIVETADMATALQRTDEYRAQAAKQKVVAMR